MKEIEIRPGLFITLITRMDYEQKLMILTGEEKQEYIEKANPIKKLNDKTCVNIFAMNKEFLLLTLRSINNDFNPETDFLYVRYEPKLLISQN